MTDEQMARVHKLQAAFAEVDDETVAQWVDGFKRDFDLESELAVWERMSVAYTGYCAKHDLALDAKKKVFKVVLLRSMASEDDVLGHLDLKVITKQDAIEVMRGF